MKRTILLLLSALLILAACRNEDDSRPDTTLVTFNVQRNEQNALRADLTAELKASTAYHIEYWEKADPATLRKTRPAVGKGIVHRTLIMLKPNTRYACRLVYEGGEPSDVREFVTGAAPDEIAHASLLVDDMPHELPGYLLVYMRKSPGYVYLLDTKGIPVWYQPIAEGVLVANLEPKTNRLYMITKPIQNDFNQAYTGRILKVMDLWGNVILEKELSTLPEMAGRKAHHECRPLPNGNAIFVTTVDRTFDLRAYGGTANEVVTGDGFAVMDLKGNIVKQWDCFETLNPTENPRIMDIKEDWLHANSINYDADGNYYMTFNRPSELWKIDPATGRVLYRVGKAGDVPMQSEGFADGMHCANPKAPDEVLVLDNARDNIRGSRALRYKVDLQTRRAELTLNCEIPRQYSSPNRGNVQQIGKDMLIFGSSVKNLILFTDFIKQVTIHRILSLQHLF